MSTEQNKEIVRRWMRDVDQGRGSLAFIEKWMAPDFRCHPPGSQEPLDVAGYRQMAGAYFAAFPEMRHEVRHLIAEGDFVAVSVRVSLVHSGAFMGVEPTGRTVEADEMVIVHIRNGKIAEEWFVLDSAALLQQVGVIPAPAEAAS
jgi:predicted ester cyclase